MIGNQQKRLGWLLLPLTAVVSLILGIQIGQRQIAAPQGAIAPTSALSIYSDTSQNATDVTREMSIVFAVSGDQQTQLQQVANLLSRYLFCDLPIDVVSIDNQVATVNLKEHAWVETAGPDAPLPDYPGCDGKTWRSHYFQGSAGGSITSTILIRSLLQPEYEGPWLQGVQFLYENTPIDASSSQFQHLSLTGVIDRDKLP